VLTAGYVGSALLGGAFITAGWDTLIAKVASLFLAVGLICPLVLVRDKLCVPVLDLCGAGLMDSSTIVLSICYEALLVGFWFADHGYARHLFPATLLTWRRPAAPHSGGTASSWAS
jgi:hypothetical protein